MTRWARSGSTQKHCKQPEDPTPWEDFAAQMHDKKLQGGQNMKTGEKKGKNIYKKKTNNREFLRLHPKGVEADKITDAVFKSNNVDLKKGSGSRVSKQEVQEQYATVSNKNTVRDGIKKKKKNVVSTHDILVSSAEIVESTTMDQNQYSNDSSDITDNIVEGENKDDNILIESSSEKKTSKKTKKEIFLEKRIQKRKENGIILLPPKIENKLYRIKKALRKKGTPVENIKEIIRKIRRAEELKCRKNMKTCFNCRESGHVLADCPKIAADNEQGIGICFKCGSTEHTSHKCSIKTSDFPYAKCFICQAVGHLTGQCPQNKHGVYVKGGRCNLCGDVNHLKKDCPRLAKVKEEIDVTAQTMDAVTSVDAEIEEARPVIKYQKKVKVVKFHH